MVGHGELAKTSTPVGEGGGGSHDDLVKNCLSCTHEEGYFLFCFVFLLFRDGVCSSVLQRLSENRISECEHGNWS